MKLHIPKTYYVRFQERGDTVLGFAIPYQDSEHKEAKNFQTTRSTLEHWSTSEEGFILDNELASGYSIGDVISRWRTSNKVWRITDPRGFELEVPSHNLATLLAQCCIDKGVIQERCLWARGDDGQNYLISEGSPEYEEALSYTERRLTRVSLRELNRGDRVLLKEGAEVIYYGGFYRFDSTTPSDNNDLHAYEWAKRRYVYEVVLDADGNVPPERRVSEISTLHVSGRIEEADPALTDEEALAAVREVLALPAERYAWDPKGRDVYTLVKNTWDQLEKVLEPLDLAEEFGDFSDLPEAPDLWVMHDRGQQKWWVLTLRERDWEDMSAHCVRIEDPRTTPHSSFKYVRTLVERAGGYRWGYSPRMELSTRDISWRQVVQDPGKLTFYRVRFKGRKGAMLRVASNYR